MPRQRLTDRPKDKRLTLKSSLVNEIDNQLEDPLSGKPAYGAWTELVESLLRKWLSGEVQVHIKPKITKMDDML